MKFPNAFAGVKKLFTAEILTLIAGACALFTSLFAITTIGAVGEGSGTGVLAGLGGTAIFGIATAVLAILGFIFMMIGLSTAGKDEPYFKTAFIFAIVGVVATALGAFVPGVFGEIIKIVSRVSEIFVTFYAIYGIINVATKLGDEALVKKGKAIITMIICVYVLVLIAQILSEFVFTAATVGAVVCSILASVLAIVEYIIYLTLLARAKKSFAQ